MSRLLTRKGQATLRNLGGLHHSSVSAPTAYAATRLGVLSSRHTAARCYATDKQDGSSFKGQMLESVQSRIAREKQERAKFAAERQTTAGSRAWGITFSTLNYRLWSMSDQRHEADMILLVQCSLLVF